MEQAVQKIDVNALPVHLFVKSPKQAKKITSKVNFGRLARKHGKRG